MWEIYDARQTAITHLAKLQPPLTAVEKITLAKEYFIMDWLRSGYEELVSRASPPTDEEAEQITFKSAMAVARAREQFRSAGSAADTVGKVFEVELKEVKGASERYTPPATS